MIEIDHLSKTFQSAGGVTQALQDICLEVETGDISGIIGMSGAGRSTEGGRRNGSSCGRTPGGTCGRKSSGRPGEGECRKLRRGPVFGIRREAGGRSVSGIPAEVGGGSVSGIPAEVGRGSVSGVPAETGRQRISGVPPGRYTFCRRAGNCQTGAENGKNGQKSGCGYGRQNFCHYDIRCEVRCAGLCNGQAREVLYTGGAERTDPIVRSS